MLDVLGDRHGDRAGPPSIPAQHRYRTTQVKGINMRLAEARYAANKIVAAIQPYCTVAIIAGSIRREKPEVGDIEIVAIPGNDTFSEDKAKMLIYDLLDRMAHRIKGQPNGKYNQWQLRQPEINLDLFYATANNFGLQLAIRTGSSKYSHYVLASGWKRKGFKSSEGVLYDRDGKATYIRTEEELFALIGNIQH
jgi:DNA polymerase/3'-5' exonuclease PolX